MHILWVTSFARDMYETSGRPLIESFFSTGTHGRLLVCHERMENFPFPASPHLETYSLDRDPYLEAWLKANAPYIAKSLGGNLEEPLCKCPGGPLEPRDKSHARRCPGAWFNKNASRWYRKIASLRAAVEHVVRAEQRSETAVVWVDSDCTFRQRVKEAHVRGWFKGTGDAFFVKHRRPVMEAGVVGYNLARRGQGLLDAVFATYLTGKYRLLERWDDSYVIQKCINALSAAGKLRAVDLAYGVGAHAAVVPHSALGPFLSHAKGRHGRILGIMT